MKETVSRTFSASLEFVRPTRSFLRNEAKSSNAVHQG
jgi:hypothetical protein